MAQETLLDPRIHEVIRALPRAQAEEIERYDALLAHGTTELEYGALFAARAGLNRRPDMIGARVVPPLASSLVWDDLHLAEAADFPKLSPHRAMYLGRMSTDMARRFAGVTSSRTPIEYFMRSATSLVGLHMATLGDMDLIRSDAAQTRLAVVEQDYYQKFLQPVAQRKLRATAQRRW